MSLLWRVFLITAGVLVVASAALAFSPATVSARLKAREAVVLAAGLLVLLAIILLLLRRTFAPLQRLTAVMRRVVPPEPGERIPLEGGSAEVVELGHAFNEMLDRLEHERYESGTRALAAMEAERLRIARELHDEVGQTITAIVLQLESIGRAAPPELREAVRSVQEAARGSVEDVREIAYRLRPEALDDFGLRAALSTLGSSLAEHAGLRIQTRVTSDLPPLDRDRELSIYRVAQESLTNVVRHSGADCAELDLYRRDGALVLEVNDDGRGVAPGAVQGTGMQGMRERALLIGGRLEVRPRRPHGTVVRLSMPLGRP